ncbi:MAG: hypothetical protein FWH47_03530 [Methanomassiliicoccaceae archaeon]|nr:hypothetical protein [Methanomassiliicoccaceae archaeon]MCL2148393.1 hypothetical protein [Methanomassiliicoccaceae archaeon]
MHEFKDGFFTSEYDRYMEARGGGMKKEGNRILEGLMRYFDGLGAEDKADICDRLCDLRFEKGEIDDFQFFLSKRIVEFLDAVCAEDRMPHLRWHYQMTGDVGMLERAYGHEMCDRRTAELLCRHYLDALYFGSHHFPDCCLTDEGHSGRLLGTVGDIIGGHGLSELEGDYLYYKGLYADWWAWESEKSGRPFDEWCAERGRDYSWTRTYSYG